VFYSARNLFRPFQVEFYDIVVEQCLIYIIFNHRQVFGSVLHVCLCVKLVPLGPVSGTPFTTTLVLFVQLCLHRQFLFQIEAWLSQYPDRRFVGAAEHLPFE